MNNISAAKVLMSHLPEISDGAYKTATEIAIESLLSDAIEDWNKSNCKITSKEYLGLTEEQYEFWVLDKRK